MDQLSQTMQERARAKIERALSFSGGGDMDMLSPGKKARTPRDQMSHRIIEKRRRDRMNNCLANLSQLIPVNYLKQGQGRIEKTEIIEMAIRHITHMQKQVQAMSTMERPCCQEKFLMGYKECRDEVMRFLVEKAAYDAADPFCLTLLKHLHKQSQKFVPESATSVYQNTSGSHQGMVGAEDMMMAPQNAGEVGGMMGDNSVEPPNHLSPATLSVMASETKHNPTSSWVSSISEPPPVPGVELPSCGAVPTSAGTASGAAPAERPNSASSTSHLSRHLLQVPNGASLAMPSMPLASISGESGYSTGRDVSGRESSVTPTSSHLNHSNITVPSSSVSSTTTTSSPPLGVDNSPDPDTNNSKQVYKFKNDIKLRFAGNMEKQASSAETSDQNSNSSKEDMEYIRPNLKTKVDTDWTMAAEVNKAGAECAPDKRLLQPRIGSAGAGAASADIKEDFVMDLEEPGSSGSKGEVPAFALHPMGTFYVPLVIKMAQLAPYLHTNNSMQLCHPISIPVNFSRPSSGRQGDKMKPSLGTRPQEGTNPLLLQPNLNPGPSPQQRQPMECTT